MTGALTAFLGVPNWIQDRLAFIKTDALPWKQGVLVSSWSIWLFETYILLRQYPNYSKKEPPAALKEHVKQDEFAKSQAYGKDKARFALFSSLYNQVLETVVIYYDVYPKLWAIAAKALPYLRVDETYSITHSIIFGVLLFLISSVPSLPLSLYQTFVLEEKHGFNKTTLGLYIADMFKGWALGAVIGIPFVAAFLWIIQWAGDSFIPYLMSFFIAFQLIMVAIYPTLIQPFFNKLSPLPEGTLKTRIEALAGRLKFPLKHLYEIDGSKRSSHSNAYFYGLPWSKHIVIFDTLIKKTPEDQIEAVLAHELGHWHFSHPSKLLVISQLQLFSQLSLFPPFLKSAPLLRSFGFPPKVAANPPILIAFMLFQMVVSPLDSVLKALMNALSRQFEWEADKFACDMDDTSSSAVSAPGTLMSDRLSKALVGLHVENAGSLWVDPLYSAYHYSHPTLTERMKAMDVYKAKRTAKSAQRKEL